MAYVGHHIVFFTALFFFILGGAWVIGFNIVKKHDESMLPRYYMIMMTIRFLLTALLILLFTLIIEDKTLHHSFALMALGMYVIMIIISFTLKH